MELSLCCNNACIEIKCLNSINYTEWNELFLDYLCKYGSTVKLKQNHNYLMQYLMQKGVRKTKNAYFVVWTTHGMVIDNITFYKELWESMKSNFGMLYKDFYLNSLFWE